MVTRALFVSVWLLAMVGCDDSPCGAPDKPEYSCEPIPGATSMTPMTCPGPMYGETSYDEDKTFPAGCQVRLPACHTTEPTRVVSCTCDRYDGGGKFRCDP